MQINMASEYTGGPKGCGSHPHSPRLRLLAWYAGQRASRLIVSSRHQVRNVVLLLIVPVMMLPVAIAAVALLSMSILSLLLLPPSLARYCRGGVPIAVAAFGVRFAVVWLRHWPAWMVQSPWIRTLGVHWSTQVFWSLAIRAMGRVIDDVKWLGVAVSYCILLAAVFGDVVYVLTWGVESVGRLLVRCFGNGSFARPKVVVSLMNRCVLPQTKTPLAGSQSALPSTPVRRDPSNRVVTEIREISACGDERSHQFQNFPLCDPAHSDNSGGCTTGASKNPPDSSLKCGTYDRGTVIRFSGGSNVQHSALYCTTCGGDSSDYEGFPSSYAQSATRSQARGAEDFDAGGNSYDVSRQSQRFVAEYPESVSPRWGHSRKWIGSGREASSWQNNAECSTGQDRRLRATARNASFHYEVYGYPTARATAPRGAYQRLRCLWCYSVVGFFGVTLVGLLLLNFCCLFMMKRTFYWYVPYVLYCVYCSKTPCCGGRRSAWWRSRLFAQQIETYFSYGLSRCTAEPINFSVETSAEISDTELDIAVTSVKAPSLAADPVGLPPNCSSRQRNRRSGADAAASRPTSPDASQRGLCNWSGHCNDNNSNFTSNLESERDRGSNLESERHPGSNLESERDPGSDLESERSRGRNLEDERDRGRNLESERDRGRSLEDERDRGRNLESERHPGSNLESERDPGSNLESERKRGRNLEDERDRGRNLEDERDRGRSLEDERGRGRNLESERDRGRSLDCPSSLERQRGSSTKDAPDCIDSDRGKRHHRPHSDDHESEPSYTKRITGSNKVVGPSSVIAHPFGAHCDAAQVVTPDVNRGHDEIYSGEIGSQFSSWTDTENTRGRSCGGSTDPDSFSGTDTGTPSTIPTPAKCLHSRHSGWKSCLRRFQKGKRKYALPRSIFSAPQIDVPDKRPVLFVYHPHGILGIGAFATFAFENTCMKQAFPDLESHLCTLNVTMNCPFTRDWFLLGGFISVGQRSIDFALQQPRFDGKVNAVTVVVGGASEALLTREYAHDIILKRRKGVFRTALKHGCRLIPVYGFGENEVFKVISTAGLAQKISALLMRIWGVALPFFGGVGMFQSRFGVFPRPTRLHVVFGRPIDCTKQEVPSQEQICKLQNVYLRELRNAFNSHKFLCRDPTVEDLRIVE